MSSENYGASNNSVARAEDSGRNLPVEGPDSGVSIWQTIGGEQPSDKDFAIARALLNGNFESVDDVTWDQLRGMITEEGWTAEQFREMYKRLLKRKTWILPGDTRPRWVIGDWFREAEAKHYGYSWFMQRTPAERELIGAYRVPGYARARYAWRAEAEGLLEPVPHVKAVAAAPGSEAFASVYGVRAGLPSGAEDLTEETHEAIDTTLLQVRNRELEEELERQQRECSRLRLLLERERDTVAELKAMLAEIENNHEEFSRKGDAHG